MKDGYVVESTNGRYLSARNIWVPQDGPEKAWIHSIVDLQALKTSSWIVKPLNVYPAKGRREKNIITGPAVSFEELMRR